MGFYVQSHYIAGNGVLVSPPPHVLLARPQGAEGTMLCWRPVCAKCWGLDFHVQSWMLPTPHISPPFSATLLEPMPDEGPLSTGPALLRQEGQTPIRTPTGKGKTFLKLALRPHPSAAPAKPQHRLPLHPTPYPAPQTPPSECPEQTRGTLGQLAVILIKILLQTLL